MVTWSLPRFEAYPLSRSIFFFVVGACTAMQIYEASVPRVQRAAQRTKVSYGNSASDRGIQFSARIVYKWLGNYRLLDTSEPLPIFN